MPSIVSRLCRSTGAAGLVLGTLAPAAAALVLLSAPAVAAPGHGQAHGHGRGHAVADRPGNNGTIKVDGQPFDDHPGNEPHVGCVLQVDFYNYGKGDFHADVTFSPHAPTASSSITVTAGDPRPFVGEDPPGGGTDLDAHETYRLSFTGAPHPKQGYHVKLTVHAPQSNGADTKHKVFWVKNCATTPPRSGTSPAHGQARVAATSPKPSAALPTLVAAGVGETNAPADRGTPGPGVGAALLGSAAVLALAAAAVARRRRGAHQA